MKKKPGLQVHCIASVLIFHQLNSRPFPAAILESSTQSVPEPKASNFISTLRPREHNIPHCFDAGKKIDDNSTRTAKPAADSRTDLRARHAKDRVKRGSLTGGTQFSGRSLRALGVNIHSVRVARSWRLVLVHELLALQTSTDILTKSLNDSHVLEPAVILLLTLTGSVTDVRL
jgi:hypothetical protein